jgi:serine protease AprX
VARISINGYSFDPVAQADAFKAADLDSIDASRSNYVLIQTRGPLADDQRAQLAKAEVVILEYIADDAYLCRYPPADLGPIRALPFVVWVSVYLPGLKVPPSLRHTPADHAAGFLPALGVPSSARRVHEVDVVVHDGVDPRSRQLKEAIAAATRMSPKDIAVGRKKLRLGVQERYLNDLAVIDQVRSIEEVPTRKLFNNVAGPIIHAHVVVNGTTYEGKGQVVAVGDTGFDKGSRTNVHPAFAGRVKKLYALGRTTPAKSDDPDGHGTHVAGSVLGDGNSPHMGGAIRGTAPKATLVVQSLLDASGGLGGIPTDLHDLFEPPYTNDKARVHTNSWGAQGVGFPYDTSSQEIDDTVWNHQDLVICFAAGNDGIDGDSNGVVDPGSVGSQSAAKNCITVGASESVRPKLKATFHTYGDVRPSSFPVNPLHADQMANNPAGLAAFSSRGPSQEGRIKPDVVAPGTSILSTHSRGAPAAPVLFGTSSDPAFFFDTGTSMATPLTAGCAAVLRETLQRNGMPDPSAALIKALLINGAVELVGQYAPTEAGLSPNANSGWGLVDLAGSVIIPGPNPNAGLGDGGPLTQGQSNTVVVSVPKGKRSQSAAKPKASAVGTAGVSPTLKVTLVWSDPPGAALQNDLDLIVRAANGQERHGNQGTGKAFDRVNNVEQVLWTNIPPGNAKIIIRAFRITQFPQPYAYVWRLS